MQLRSLKWKRLIGIAAVLEVLQLAGEFGIPALHGRVFGNPKFPQLIVFHGDVPRSDIVDFQGNFYQAAAEWAAIWLFVVVVIALVVGVVKSFMQPAKLC